jgi:hypothetical protein
MALDGVVPPPQQQRQARPDETPLVNGVTPHHHQPGDAMRDGGAAAGEDGGHTVGAGEQGVETGLVNGHGEAVDVDVDEAGEGAREDGGGDTEMHGAD